MTEPREARLKRMKMRSMRRGIKEMDLILSAYAERALADMTPADLDLYDALLQENDRDLYEWVTEQQTTPDTYSELLKDIRQVFYNK